MELWGIYTLQFTANSWSCPFSFSYSFASCQEDSNIFSITVFSLFSEVLAPSDIQAFGDEWNENRVIFSPYLQQYLNIFPYFFVREILVTVVKLVKYSSPDFKKFLKLPSCHYLSSLILTRLLKFNFKEIIY